MRGPPCIGDTRVPVSAVLGQLAADASIDELLDDYPHLEREDVLAALEFAAAADESGARGGRNFFKAVPQNRLRSSRASYPTSTDVTHAIYLVFWFDRSKWDEDYRYARSTFSTAGSARHFFNEQARELRQSGLQVRAMVLDGSLP